MPTPFASGLYFGFVGIEFGLIRPDFLGNLTYQLYGIISNDLLLAIPFFGLAAAAICVAAVIALAAIGGSAASVAATAAPAASAAPSVHAASNGTWHWE